MCEISTQNSKESYYDSGPVTKELFGMCVLCGCAILVWHTSFQNTVSAICIYILNTRRILALPLPVAHAVLYAVLLQWALVQRNNNHEGDNDVDDAVKNRVVYTYIKVCGFHSWLRRRRLQLYWRLAMLLILLCPFDGILFTMYVFVQ